MAREYLETLVDATERTLAECRRDLDTHVYPVVVVLPSGNTAGPFRWMVVDRFVTDTVQAWVGLMPARIQSSTALRYGHVTVATAGQPIQRTSRRAATPTV